MTSMGKRGWLALLGVALWCPIGCSDDSSPEALAGSDSSPDAASDSSAESSTEGRDAMPAGDGDAAERSESTTEAGGERDVVAEAAAPSLCDQVCAAMEKLSCARTGEVPCVTACEASQAGNCGAVIRDMRACLVDQSVGWVCLGDTITVKREQCAIEIEAAEACLLGSSYDARAHAGDGATQYPDGPSDTSSASGDLDGGNAGIDSPDASEAGDMVVPSDALGEARPDAPHDAPAAALPTRCSTYCDVKLAVGCPQQQSPANCVQSCEQGETGPCAGESATLHACIVASHDPWVCVQDAAIGNADDVCPNEMLSWVLCLAEQF